MKNLSLKLKIWSILAPLILIGFILGSILLFQMNKEKNQAHSLLASAQSQMALSEVIHEFQRERGMSILFLNKKISSPELMDQQKKVTGLLEIFLNKTKLISFSKKEVELNTIQKEIEDSRHLVTNNASIPELLSSFASTINHLIHLQINLFEETKFQGLESRFISLTLLEESKDRMGGLRAFLNGTFAGNLKKEDADRDRVFNLLSGITINLESTGLNISNDSKNKAFEILNSDEWKDVLKNVQIFTEKYSTGDYQVDASNFSKTITARIDSVYEIVKLEQNINLSQLKTIISSHQRDFYLLAISLIVAISIVSFYAIIVMNRLVAQFRLLGSTLGQASDKVSSASNQIATSSEQLSHATHEQAASLQETSASIEEISSMINANTENAKQSTRSSDQSLKTAERGKIVIENMLKAIDDISESNNGIMNQINETNHEIENIVKIINEIGSKTKVINDIVFQTKLLSFNASVEAARAGEQGSGFSVVAEEVGNLAAMSGSAAHEISKLLSESTMTVEATVRNSKEKISKLVLQGKEKVEIGLQVAHECQSVLNDIVTSVSSVSQMVSEISIASQEQAQGVQEITKAVAQLDQVTQLNTASSSESSQSAGSLSSQAEALNKLVESLVLTINGGTILTPTLSEVKNVVSKKEMTEKNVIAFKPLPQKDPIIKSTHTKVEKKIVNGLPFSDDDRFEDI